MLWSSMFSNKAQQQEPGCPFRFSKHFASSQLLRNDKERESLYVHCKWHSWWQVMLDDLHALFFSFSPRLSSDTCMLAWYRSILSYLTFKCPHNNSAIQELNKLPRFYRFEPASHANYVSHIFVVESMKQNALLNTCLARGRALIPRKTTCKIRRQFWGQPPWRLEHK